MVWLTPSFGDGNGDGSGDSGGTGEGDCFDGDSLGFEQEDLGDGHLEFYSVGDRISGGNDFGDG